MISEHDVRASILPLRLVFWGGLLCVLDLTFSSTTNGRGYRFDILNDTVGAILITVGVIKLARAPVGGRYQPVMSFITVVAALSIVETAIKHVVFPHPSLLGFAISILGFAQLAAFVLFCLAMRWFALEGGLPRSAASWRVTMILFLCIYAIPLGILYAAGLLATAAGTRFNLNLGAAGLLLIPVFLIPPLHLFISVSRMSKEAQTGGVYQGHAFPVIPAAQARWPAESPGELHAPPPPEAP